MNTTLRAILIAVITMIVVAIVVSPFLPEEDEVSDSQTAAESSETPRIAPPSPEAVPPPPATTPEPSPEPAEATPEPTLSAQTEEDIAVYVFRDLTSDLETGTSDNLSDEAIVEFAGAVCEMAALSDTGDQFLVFVEILVEDSPMSPEDTGATIGALLGAFCADEAERLELW